MKNFKAIIIFILFLLSSCNNNEKKVNIADEYYTCSMHPQIMQDKQGTCPICHMDLIVVKKATTSENEIILNDEQIKLGNIQTDTIKNGTISNQIVLTATLSTNQAKVKSINSRTMGRLDHLYFKNVGDYITQGAHIYDIYSEELNNTKQEYIVALEKQQTLGNSIIDFNKLVQSAKTKLLLWGMGEKQINELTKTKKINSLTSFYSNASGYITELPVFEGQYVTEETTILKVADLSNLWVEAQVYTSQLSNFDLNGSAIITIPDLPGKEWKGKIEFTNPEINSVSRINLIRITIENNTGLLKPGMPAYVTIKNKTIQSLTLPSNAVLRDGKMNVVWIKNGINKFKRKMVETGLENDNSIEIKSGLHNGDIVVTNGAYLLQSELIFKKGASPMAGIEMSAH
jgi:membrane fusion protein, copper/silver efflux system